MLITAYDTYKLNFSVYLFNTFYLEIKITILSFKNYFQNIYKDLIEVTVDEGKNYESEYNEIMTHMFIANCFNYRRIFHNHLLDELTSQKIK